MHMKYMNFFFIIYVGATLVSKFKPIKVNLQITPNNSL